MFEFKKMRVRFFVSLFVLLATYLLIVVFKEKALEMLSNIPDGFKKMIEGDFLERISRDPQFYFVSQWNWKNLAQIVPIVSIVMGFPIFSREIERGTIHFLLSNFTRKRVFLEKTNVGLTCVALISLTALLPVFNGLPPRIMFFYFIHTLVASVFWFSVSETLSLLFDDQVKPLLSSLGIFALLLVLEGFKKVRMLSYIGDPRIFQGGGMDICTTIKLLIASGVLMFISFRVFKTREF